MVENSKIEWCDHTFNPWIGCQKVSPGCDNCYAEALMDKRYHRVSWGPHGERKRTSNSNWSLPMRWNRSARKQHLDRRPTVFCGSLCDWLDNRVPNQWREDLACVIEATPDLEWLLLTKRPENFPKLGMWHDDDIPSNVRLGFTAEDQEHFDRRYPFFAPFRNFVSYEPALGPLRLGAARPDWIICGGESGPGSRPMDDRWARDLRDECRLASIPFFMKQMARKAEIPPDLLVREWPEAA